MADVVVADQTAVVHSLTYMVAVSVVVLALMYWREGIDRRFAVACLLLYLPSFLAV